MFKLGLLLVTVGASCFIFAQASILTDEELKQLADAPLVPIKVQGRTQAVGRSMEDTIKQIKKFCKCRGKECSCCTEVEVSFFSVEACAKMTIIPQEKAFEVFLAVGEKPIVKHKISAHQLEKVCKSPAKVKDLELCLYTTLDEDKPNELTSCMSLDITYHEILLGNINFDCLKYANNKLTFVENDVTGKDEALANINVKNPFHVIAKLIKALIDKLE